MKTSNKIHTLQAIIDSPHNLNEILELRLLACEQIYFNIADIKTRIVPYNAQVITDGIIIPQTVKSKQGLIKFLQEQVTELES